MGLSSYKKQQAESRLLSVSKKTIIYPAIRITHKQRFARNGITMQDKASALVSNGTFWRALPRCRSANISTLYTYSVSRCAGCLHRSKKKPLTAFGKILAPIGFNLGVQLYAVLFRPLTHIQRFQQMREAPQVFGFMQQVDSNKNSNLHKYLHNFASTPFPQY